MTCGGCGFETQTGFAFCPRCGVRLPQACPGCGNVCAPDFTFCPRCGGRLAAPLAASASAQAPPEALPATRNVIADAAAPVADGSHEADRRQVTVVFADLSGFTALSERLDPEEIRALQSELF